MRTEQQKAQLKERARIELIELGVIFSYLFITIGIFVTYRRLVLRAADIEYTHYGLALIKALIGAKVILLTQNLRIVHKHEEKALLYPTLFKSGMFTLFMILFSIVEKGVEAMIHHRSFLDGLRDITSLGAAELVAGNLVLLACFIPFFAFREMERVIGEKALWNLLAHGIRPPATGPEE